MSESLQAITPKDVLDAVLDRNLQLTAMNTDLLDALEAAVRLIKQSGGHMWPVDQAAMRSWLCMLEEQGRKL